MAIAGTYAPPPSRAETTPYPPRVIIAELSDVLSDDECDDAIHGACTKAEIAWLRDVFNALLVVCGVRGSTTLVLSELQHWRLAGLVKALFNGRVDKAVTLNRSSTTNAVELVSQTAPWLREEMLPESSGATVQLVAKVAVNGRFHRIPLVDIPCSKYETASVARKANDCWGHGCKEVALALAGTHETAVGVVEVLRFSVHVKEDGI